MRFLFIITLVCCTLISRADAGDEKFGGGSAKIVRGNGLPTLKISLSRGESLDFELQPTEVMSPALAAKFPEIRTWMGRSLENPYLSVRCDESPSGLQVQLFTPEGTIYIEEPTDGARRATPGSPPEKKIQGSPFQCLTETEATKASTVESGPATDTDPQPFHKIRTFRLAVATAGEYTEFHGGTVESAMAAIVTVVNRINGIYERELGIRLLLVPNNDQVIFTNKTTDPFTENFPSLTTIHQSQETFDLLLGSANYDVGILFNTGTYGLAYLGSICNPQRKGAACIGMPDPVGEFFMTYAAHEMSHQFGANHTFNTPQGPCGPSRHAPSAVEPGTGSTLMSYAGLPCSNDSWQPLMHDYFHAESIRQIQAVLATETCSHSINTGNRLPSVTVPADFFVPKETPFVLRAVGSDPDGHALSYCWEQLDIGPAKTLAEPDNGLSPLFRSFPPTTNAARVFPKMESLLQNLPSTGEQLPTTNRVMHFRVTVRDSQNMGAKAYADTHVHVIETNGPFRITSHNLPGVFNDAQTITWDVAGTTNLPIHAHNVNLLLSTNGGQTFNIVLATNTLNDGSEVVTFPAITAASARLKIEPVGNIFFDINDANIAIGFWPRFEIATMTGTNLHLRWTFQNGKQYRLERATTLPPIAWEELNVSTATNGNEMEAFVPITTDPKTFFRIREF